MPGISDRSSLKYAILDSLSVTISSVSRIRARGAFDVISASRLRHKEEEMLRCREPVIFGRLVEVSRAALREKKAGNEYVYSYLQLILRSARSNRFLMALRSARVKRASHLATELTYVKMPREQYDEATKNIPDGIDKAFNEMESFRAVKENLMNMYSTAGKHRGKLQAITTHNRNDLVWDEKIAEFYEKFDAETKNDRHPSPGVISQRFGKEYGVTMVRLSDLIYMSVQTQQGSRDILLTGLHFERMCNALTQYANIIYGATLSYGLEDKDISRDVHNATYAILEALVEIGVRDDLGAGEAGKAATDMYKAHLSQTPELPFNNLNLLCRTYTSQRERAGREIYDLVKDRALDPDITLNLTYAWKTALQPDSDLKKDFLELSQALTEPNPIADTSEVTLECAMRRALVIGALKEGRQIQLTSTNGEEIPLHLKRAVNQSIAPDSLLNTITYADVRHVRVRVNELFPEVGDISHLTFKDKSSAVEGSLVRKDIFDFKESFDDLQTAEDRLIFENARVRSDIFFDQLRTESYRPKINKVLRATVNDIISSLDVNISEVFKNAEYKFKEMYKSFKALDKAQGDEGFIDSLKDMLKDRPDLLINTATEPKLGEVHKRSVRIFYMFEKGMKTYLSQFERLARIMDYYIKGAEIVKGDRAREKHMNILSSAHKATEGGKLAYQVLFDLSKFSQKFNHKLIDAAAKVIGEAVDYPYYAMISSLFKASFLFVASRNVYEYKVGILGAFEGFLNFLWTGIHATVMDIALKNCGRSGDLAAYSDDGLLMFMMTSNLDSPDAVIHEELNSIITSITTTYTEYGLDFNLGKTLISRELAEFLGVVQHRGKRFPTWIKELSHLGITEVMSNINPIGQGIDNTASQMTALIKSGMNPYAAMWLGHFEIFMGVGHRVFDIAMANIATGPKWSVANGATMPTLAFFCLPSAFGGVRTPDILTAMTTADYDPISETLADLSALSELYPEAQHLFSFILEAIEPTDDYLSIISGASPVSTKCIKYSHRDVQKDIVKKLRHLLPFDMDHPLSKSKCPKLHLVLECMENLHLPMICSLTRYAVPMLEYEKKMSITRSSALSKLLKKHQLRSIQATDTKRVKAAVGQILESILNFGVISRPDTLSLYQKSYPRLSFAQPVQSYRDLAKLCTFPTRSSYEAIVSPADRVNGKKSYRLMNRQFRDEVAPPLVTSDVNVQHLNNAPDPVSHCMRGLVSETISASSQGHDILPLVNEICRLNKAPLMLREMMSHLTKLQKIAVANRKKAIHRVHWSMSTRACTELIRSGELHWIMSESTDTHYSMVVTVALASIHLMLGVKGGIKRSLRLYVDINPDIAYKTRVRPMRVKPESYRRLPRDYEEDVRYGYDRSKANMSFAIRNETTRALNNAILDLQDNMLSGRMSMLSDLRPITKSYGIAEPLRYATMWALVNKIESVLDAESSIAGVREVRLGMHSLDSVPTELVDLAAIYRSWRKVRKSELNSLIKGRTSGPLLDVETARSTLDALDLLTLKTTLTLDSLRSDESATIYNSMLTASEFDLFYYALDVRSESIMSTSISSTRAKAMGRVIDSLISKLFLEEQNTPQVDLKKLMMMIIRGSVRGSIHRSEPFNVNVTMNWMVFYCQSIIRFREDIDNPFYFHVGRDNRRPAFPDELSHFLLNRLELGYYSTVPRLGDIRQFRQASAFVKKLMSWGVITQLMEVINMERIADYYHEAWDQYIYPALTVVRTVSYTNLEKALLTSSLPDSFVPPKADTLGTIVEQYLSNLDVVATSDNLYHARRLASYRMYPGELDTYALTLESGHIDPGSFPYLLAATLAMPLLLSIGFTYVTSVRIAGGYMMTHIARSVASAIHTYTLPDAMTESVVDMDLIIGFSEADLIIQLEKVLDRTQGRSLIVCEIPPASSYASLGLIKKATSMKDSYITVAVSSDLRGVSLYVAFYGMLPIDTPTQNVMVSDQEALNLGYLSISSYIKAIKSGYTRLLPALMLTPMQQCGLPLSATYQEGDQIIPMPVTEELVDRAQVSFIDVPRTNIQTIQLTTFKPSKVAHLIRAWKYKTSTAPAVPALIIASAHFYHAMYPQYSVEVYSSFFCEIINMIKDRADQCRFVSAISNSLNMMPMPTLSSLPPNAQLEEGVLPEIPLPRFVYDSYCNFALAELKVSAGVNKFPSGNPLHEYIITHPEGLTARDIYMAFISPPDEVEHQGTVRIIPKAQLTLESVQDMIRSIPPPTRDDIDIYTGISGPSSSKASPPIDIRDVQLEIDKPPIITPVSSLDSIFERLGNMGYTREAYMAVELLSDESLGSLANLSIGDFMAKIEDLIEDYIENVACKGGVI